MKQRRPSHSPRKKFPSQPPRRLPRLLLIVGLTAMMIGGYAAADWYICLPDDAVATYVGRQSCVQCHQGQAKLFAGSHHDLAMDHATPETVLGDFDDATLEHFGIISRMFRDGERYMINTEGPNGSMQDFQIKYVFGVEPLQQYMVEFDRPADMSANELARLQVLRVSWDTERNRWFYLPPPDVDDKLATHDPLHWTRRAQNWNHMCASCHSTDLKKNFDVKTNTYHTTFSEIDVSCEACHGPGSLHVQMAEGKSLFWDRKRKYGLAPLKSSNTHVEIEACAGCHSRRRFVHGDPRPDHSFYDHFSNEVLRPDTYYCDGQIRDEVYVYGSFIQSKMYHKGIRCTDCHDPHSTQLKHQGNQLCVSCHTHMPAKYDSTNHHFHSVGSEGAKCINCHMPQTPFMEIDLRADHSLRVPRPDLSLTLDTPNACTGCHLELENLPAEKRETLKYYADWLEAARAGDPDVSAEIERVNRWSAEWCEKWYGQPDEEVPSFATSLAKGWDGDLSAIPELETIARSRRYAGIVRASALAQIGMLDPNQTKLMIHRLKDDDPQVRLVAIANLEFVTRSEQLKHVAPLLSDPVQAVRSEAARVLRLISPSAFPEELRRLFQVALQEFRDGLLEHSDQAAAHMGLGILAERMENRSAAERSYRTAIRVQPDVIGPRAHLANLLERQNRPEEVAQLRAGELKLLERDALLAPDLPVVQYQYGLALYLNQRLEDAAVAIGRAVELDPDDPTFLQAAAMIQERLGNWKEAHEYAKRLVDLDPSNEGNRILYQRIRARL